jgi:hypothetical protein
MDDSLKDKEKISKIISKKNNTIQLVAVKISFK